MKLKNIVLIAAFAAAAALVIVMPKNGGASAGGPAGSGSAAGTRPGAGPSGARAAAGASSFRITAVAAELADVRSYIETNGDVEADNTVEVYPDIAGRLVSLRAGLGSFVRKGDAIAEIDPSKPGASYAISQVLAPISGTVTSLPLTAGSTVSASSVVAVIGDISRLEVSARIPERDVGMLKNGLKAEVSVEAYPGEIFAATVASVSPLVDSVSRTKEIRLAFDSVDARINAGMFARVKLYTTVNENAVVVPESALLAGEGENYLYVVNADSTVSRREVSVGATVDGRAVVASGLEAGERVAVEGIVSLSDGASVKVIGDPASSLGGES